MSYRILSIDGGGVRGLIAAKLLERLTNAHPTLIENVDFMAGTSTGAVICVCLAHGLTAEEITRFYYTKSDVIFSRSVPRRVGMQLLTSKYDNNGLRTALTNVFGNTKLGELNKKIIISSFDMDTYDGAGVRTYKPKFFHNLSCENQTDLDIKVVDILMYTTAAPSYFPTCNGYIDGGMVANNPSVVALAQALDPHTVPSPLLQDISLLSIGTGKPKDYIAGNNLDWGYVQWAPSLVNLMMCSSVDVADYQCKQILKERYARLNPYVDDTFDLDSVKNVDLMMESANDYDISQQIQWLGTHF